ncbi:hypothetical protein GCM10010840_13780 [Deinococcus aerolatus]|uniref:Uncharacterized protein n=1 Tax=Deinococcus aerolatus TaxID=522487 RepID=A0ABQ2G5R6_9DEIO|nr:hypothetical protein GCM10010840_13780 [Deinococcus aerolatus]
MAAGQFAVLAAVGQRRRVTQTALHQPEFGLEFLKARTHGAYTAHGARQRGGLPADEAFVSGRTLDTGNMRRSLASGCRADLEGGHRAVPHHT